MNGDDVGRFVYWSERAIQTVAQENGVELDGQRRWTFQFNSPPFQAGLGGRERRTRNRLAEARSLERGLGRAAVDDFDTVPAAAFVKGVGTVSFSRFSEFRYAGNDAVLLHVQSRSAGGRRVDLCLFGSMDNVRGMGPYDGFEQGWTSSAAPAIAELLASRGRENTSQWDDEQSRAVEALNIALNQGETGTHAEHAGRPETRGFTIGHTGDSQFFAEVYTDVLLDPQRWNLDGQLAGAERIIVGRPLWVRSMSPAAVVRYAELRNGPGWARWWWLHRLRRRLRRRPRPVTPVPDPAADGPDTDEIPPRPPAADRTP
ncbi:hypothetical protein [Streptomyces sp. NPDC001165]|uniref:hypothetical protein n=1 Tax=Streptomyces sp. NPDC001165 TaxID=3364546 RepID=UPI003677BA6A